MTLDEVLDLIRERIMPPIKEKFALLAAGMSGEDPTQFQETAKAMILEALSDIQMLKAERGVEVLDNDEFEFSALHEIARGLNSVLPVDHDFIVAILNLQNREGFDFTCMRRADDQRLHELITPDVVPLISAESAEKLAAGECDIVTRFPGEDLDEDP